MLADDRTEAEVKPFAISQEEVMEADRRVKANKGASEVDGDQKWLHNFLMDKWWTPAPEISTPSYLRKVSVSSE